MPRPPPPSASYNLVLDDTSSEEEEEVEYYPSRDGVLNATCSRVPIVHADAYLAPSIDGGDGGGDEEGDGRGETRPSSPPPSVDAGVIWASAVRATAVPAGTLASDGKLDGAGGCSNIRGREAGAEVATVTYSSLALSSVMESNPSQSSIESCSKRIRAASLESPLHCQLSGEEEEGDEEDDDDAEGERGGGGDAGDDETAAEAGASKKKKKKKKKRKKKKKTKTSSAEGGGGEDSAVVDAGAAMQENPPHRRSSKKKSLSFGTVSVREFARTLGKHVVPADGGWPLGLSDEVVADHAHRASSVEGGDGVCPSSPPNEDQRRDKEESPPSPDSKRRHGNDNGHHGWAVEDFEFRRQQELRKRYEDLVYRERRHRFERECEKRHRHAHPHHLSHNTRGRSRSLSSVFSKKELTAEEKAQLEVILKEPVRIPGGTLETRPYDYKRKNEGGGGVGSGSCGFASKDGPTDGEAEDELVAAYNGRNPLFVPLKEDQRKQVLIRDTEYGGGCKKGGAGGGESKGGSSDADHHRGHYDSTELQHVRHYLESLRIRRSDPANLGCSCRKLHVFLPGGENGGHGKKKGSHRRLPERKVREELRRRGLRGGGSREEMERRLHDTIEKEPCCWGNDCPCVQSGIGCQADTCSCWHPGHDAGGSSSSNNSKKKASGVDDGGSRRIVEEKVDMIEKQCGNRNGMYVVNCEVIRKYREQYVNARNALETGESASK